MSKPNLFAIANLKAEAAKVAASRLKPVKEKEVKSKK